MKLLGKINAVFKFIFISCIFAAVIVAIVLFGRLMILLSEQKIKSEYVLELVDQDSVRVYSELSGTTQTVLFDSLQVTIEKDNK